jgi:Domain of unknown function (DUF4280)
MPYLAVVDGAILRCNKGSRPSLLHATVPMTPSVDGKPVATIFDNQPGINVMPFGVCSITKRSCDPVTPIPWVPGETSIPLPSLFPVLTEISLLPCRVGGIIKVEDPGQSILLVDCAMDPSALSQIRDFLKSILDLRTALEFALDVGAALGELFLDRWATRFLGMAHDAFKSIFKLNLKSLRWRLGQFKLSWKYLKKGLKLKVAAKALGALGNLLGLASIGYDLHRKDYRGAAANAIGFGAGLVCAYFAAPTVVGEVGCVALSYGVSKYSRYAIDHPRQALENAAIFATPAGPLIYGSKWAVEHHDDIRRGAEKAKDFAVDRAGDAFDKGKELGEGAVKEVGKVWRQIPKPKPVPWPFP